MTYSSDPYNWRRDEQLWTLGNTSFSLYPIMIFTGIILAFLTVCYFWKRQKYPWEILQVILIIAIPTAILGARIWFIIFDSPSSWNQFFVFSGLSIHGAIFFSTLAVLPYLYSKRHVIDVRTALGMIVPAIFIGQVMGRIGNFTNHEVYGPVVDKGSLDWLGWIGIQQNMYIEGNYRAPFFLYEIFGTLTGYILVVWILLYRNWVRPGVTAGLYLVIYGIIRVIMEPLRDPMDMTITGGVQVSTVTSILMIIFGMFLIGWWQFLSRPFYPFIEKMFSKNFLKKFQKNYELITPIKPRRKYLWFGKKQDTKLRFTFFGKKVPNNVRIWIPTNQVQKWSKREINAGHKIDSEKLDQKKSKRTKKS